MFLRTEEDLKLITRESNETKAWKWGNHESSKQGTGARGKPKALHYCRAAIENGMTISRRKTIKKYRQYTQCFAKHSLQPQHTGTFIKVD